MTMAHDRVKDEILNRFSDKLSMSFAGSRARFENKNHGVRLVISVSKRYEELPSLYWYGFNESQIDFLDQARQGYFIMGFLDSGRAFAIPHEKMKQMVKEMNYTVRQSKRNYHVLIRFHKGNEVISALRMDKNIPRTDNRIFEFLEFEF